ncbi:MAG: histidine kinase [Deltaproteobacteria bacterium]|nr:histidine kinase [Deltaproteobacteria bacterium]MBW1923132.1 histidine kinase [Deltaproteobacteria bacterium]MBW1949156.1 histidine kinase [Deltaproteobacteria bacterium]MBW2007539.1 histidine kinase [Deltaproteobacteria bacterium]MBW2346692.1 histidine kinase [Deltaproteobacteria bacterium]
MPLWNRLSLRARIYFLLTALVCITMFGALVTVWYTWRIQATLGRLIDRNFAALEIARGLELALVNQKGFVSYYFMDGDERWLKKLGKHRRVFEQKIEAARSLEKNTALARLVDEIEAQYASYVHLKDRIIRLYRAGEKTEGRRLHEQVRPYFFKILLLCRAYTQKHRENVLRTRTQDLRQARNLRAAATMALLGVIVLGGVLLLVLVRSILDPVRELAKETEGTQDSPKGKNEVKALSMSVKRLMEDMGRTQTELDKSRETLFQSEKLALVGKLAAGMAHSIRNPLTSVKMRLFSLERSLVLSPSQQDDFTVISDEIRHIDIFLQNFLEFSRPPKLKMKPINPSEVVDTTLTLLRHRLRSYGVRVTVQRKSPLPVIQADPEQLKEALANIMINACEAMEGGGDITVTEDSVFSKTLGPVVRIRIQDTGPGIPISVQDKILEPFFTTKEEGTGLGLSIVARIVEEHGGRLELESREGEGSVFAIILPAKQRGQDLGTH